LVIGNPPYADLSLNFRNNSEVSNETIHNQFMLAQMEYLKQSGIMVVVITHNFLDKQNSSTRKKLAEQSKFLGAIRLPSSTFKAVSGTEVITDIVFLQKKTFFELENDFKAQHNVDENGNSQPLPSPFDDSWINSNNLEFEFNQFNENVKINDYFTKNPSMIIGEQTVRVCCFGEELDVLFAEQDRFAEFLDTRVAELTKKVIPYSQKLPDNIEELIKLRGADVLNNQRKISDVFFDKDGKLNEGYVFDDEKYIPNNLRLDVQN